MKRRRHRLRTTSGEATRAVRSEIDEGTFLPSLSFNWFVSDKSQLRATASRTVARPDFKETSNATFYDNEFDFRVRGTRVLIECDGWTYHGLDRRNFERDRARDADLIAAGWVVLRFTYRMITARPVVTASRIDAALRRWAGMATPPPPGAA